MPGPIAGALDTCKPGRFLGDERPFIPGIIRRGVIREPFGVGLKPPPTLPTLIKKHKYIYFTRLIYQCMKKGWCLCSTVIIAKERFYSLWSRCVIE